jgi:hypothetical protein
MTATDVRPAHQALTMEELREHLVVGHGRAAHELGALPLDAVHELEHFDDTVGLLQLHHHHD